MATATEPRAEREAYVAALRSGTTLAQWAARQPDEPAVVTPGDAAGGRTFAELNAEANRLARALRRDRLAHDKRPRRVEFRGSLPRTDAGKRYKRRLRDRYRATAAGGEEGTA